MEVKLKSITKRQAAVLDFIRAYRREFGYPPTRRNITDEFGFKSPNAAEEHLRALDRKGFIELRRNTSRGIIVRDLESDHLPIIGRVAAGSPIMVEEHVERESMVSGAMFDPHADYLLRVQGESMIDIGIFDGDLVAVHKTPEARDNQIVVARLEEEVTVKRFKRDHENKEIHLIPENKEYQTIKVDENSTDLRIEGVSVGLIRMHM